MAPSRFAPSPIRREGRTPSESLEDRARWVVVWAAFVCVAVIFGVAYSFAAFFRPFAAEFAADRADVSLVFGLSGLIYFLLGAGAGMLADRFGPRAVCAAGMVVHRRRSAREQLRAVDGGDLRRLGRRPRHRHRPRLRAVDRAACRRGSCAGARSPRASPAPGSASARSPCRCSATAAIAALGWRHALQALAAGVVVFGVGATLLLRRAPPRARRARRRPE